MRVAANGHPHTRRRPLRDKGVSFILQTCRAMYGYTAKRRHLPPYAENPFAGLTGRRFRIEDAKPIFVFDEESELSFLKAAEAWDFCVHFLLAKTGLRVGEVTRLLVEDVDLDAAWLRICSRPALGAATKTRQERDVPIIAEVGQVIRTIPAVASLGAQRHHSRSRSSRVACAPADRSVS